MQFPPGMVAVAVLCGLVAAAATTLSAVDARRRAGPHRQAYALLAAASGVVLVSLLVGVSVALSTAGHAGHAPDRRTGWAGVVAIGTAVGGLIFSAGLLRLPGVAATAAATARLALDGLVMAAAFWFVGWVLFSEPTRLLGDATPAACVPILLATVSAALTAGLALIVAFRAPSPRGRAAWLGAGATAVTCGGLGIATGALPQRVPHPAQAARPAG
ncbi:GGDEF-domain containing protein, partial [Micromonospora sp. NPDC023633]